MSANFSVYTSEHDNPLIYEYDELPDALLQFLQGVTEGEFARIDFSA
jgi:hypothetical protein